MVPQNSSAVEAMAMKGNTAILGILRNVDRTIESPASDDPRKKRLTYYAALSIPLEACTFQATH